MLKRFMIGGFVVCCILAIGIGYSFGIAFTSSSTGTLTIGTPAVDIRTSANVNMGYESTADGVTYTVQTKHLQGDRRFAAEAEQQSIFYESATAGASGMASIAATTGNDITGWSILGS